MKNFINVRLATSNAYKEKNDIKHNIRTVNVLSTYKSKSGQNWRKWQNSYYSHIPQNQLQQKLKNLRDEHNKLHYQRRKRNLQNSQATLINSIISFSEKCSHDLGVKYSREEFEKCCIKAIEDIATELNTEIFYISFHYDEKTPHVHFNLRNFNDKGYAIWNNENKKKGSKLQDIAFNSLKELGMKRGEKKELTGVKRHQTTQEYYKKVFYELNKSLKTLRSDVKDLELTKEEKKLIYAEITRLQKQAREQKKENQNKDEKIKEISQYAEELREALKEQIANKKSKKGMKNV